MAYYRPSLQYAVDYYGINLHYKHNLVAVDGEAKVAIFDVTAPDGSKSRETRNFDMLHVTPPQSAPDFIKNSPFAGAGGWVDVDRSSRVRRGLSCAAVR